MEEKNYSSLDECIKKEVKRLKRIFANLDKNKYLVVLKLIENAAFMAVTLDDLTKKINENGCTSEYQNGEHQFGVKKSPEVEIHIAMTKNYSSVIKQLVELCPPEEKRNSRLNALRKM